MLKYPNTPEQATWIIQAKHGNKLAFSRIVQKYQPSVYNLCYHMLQSREDADEAAQEIFLRVYTRLDSYDNQYQFSPWLFAITKHYCLDRLKQPRRHLIPWGKLADLYHSPDRGNFQPEEALLKAETAQEVEKLVKSLHPDYRQVIILKYWHTMSYEEIARMLDTTVSAIKSRLFRARKMLTRLAA